MTGTTEQRLRERIGQLSFSMRELDAHAQARPGMDTFTDDEAKRYGTMKQEKGDLERELDGILERREKENADWMKRRGATAPGQLADGTVSPSFDDGERMDAAGDDRPRLVTGKPRGRRYADLFGANGGTDRFKSFEEFLATLHSGRADERLRSAISAASGHREHVGADGGFLVPEAFAARLLDNSMESEIVRPRAQVEPMETTKKIAGPSDTDHSTGAPYGLSGIWVEEGKEMDVQKSKWRTIELNARKLAIFTEASNELIEDGASFESQLEGSIIASLAWGLDNAFLRGSGAGQPRGVLNDPALITVPKEIGQVAATIVYENLTKMFARLHPASVKNSVWVASSTTIPSLLNLSIGVGAAGAWYPALSESNGSYTLLSRPVIFTEKLPAIGAKGDILLADFSQYTVGLRRRISIDKSGHAGFSKDVSFYRAIVRADGMGRWPKAFTPANGDTLSWCVTLAART